MPEPITALEHPLLARLGLIVSVQRSFIFTHTSRKYKAVATQVDNGKALEFHLYMPRRKPNKVACVLDHLSGLCSVAARIKGDEQFQSAQDRLIVEMAAFFTPEQAAELINYQPERMDDNA